MGRELDHAGEIWSDRKNGIFFDLGDKENLDKSKNSYACECGTRLWDNGKTSLCHSETLSKREQRRWWATGKLLYRIVQTRCEHRGVLF